MFHKCEMAEMFLKLIVGAKTDAYCSWYSTQGHRCMACLLGNERSLVQLKESILEEAMDEPIGRGRPASFWASWRWPRRAGLIPSAADDIEGWSDSADEVCVYEVRPGCVCVCARVHVFRHSGLTVCDPMDDSTSMGFARQEDCSGLLFPTPGDFPDRGIEPASLVSPALAGRFFFTTVPPGKPPF